MPLRRSKSLNDKVTRQKHRSSDVVRDPRCPDAGGGGGGGAGGGGGGRSRTRTCLDNYQLLVHLKKQTDDKSRQLELAYTYGGNAPSFLRPGAAQRASAHRPLSEFHPSPSFALESGPAGAAAQPYRSASPRPAAAGGHYRQHSADGCSRQEPGRAVKRQESISEGQLGRSSLQPSQRCPRPMSMFEQRTSCAPPPTKEDWARKNQIIHNLTENQKCVDSHNRLLRSKIDELELENAHLKEILDAHNIPHVTLSRASKLQPPDEGAPLVAQDLIHGPVSEAFPKLSGALLSPMSDTSVSGYGSLAGSAYDEGYMATLEAGGGKGRKTGEEMGATAEEGGYNDDTLPLSEMSVERVGSADSSLLSTLSSGGISRVPTTNREAGKDDLQSIHEKLDQVLDLERHRGGDGKRRVVELERRVEELTEQRNSVLKGYKHIVEEHRKLQAREEHVQGELRALLQQHWQTLQHVLRQELQQLQQELQDLGQDVRGQLDLVLVSLASSSPSSPCSSSSCVGRDRREECGGPMDPDVRVVVDKVVDLIGPEYLRLGRRLNVPPLELEKIEEGREDFAHKTKRVLQTWLKRHRQDSGEGESSGVNVPPPAQVLTRALRDIDKDVRLFNHDPISAPERQALRNCLQVAIDHVTDVSDLLDYLIVLNVLSPAGITFVQEVAEESGERALCRLWHVTEYRGSGVLSRLALALQRAGYPHVSRRLTDELEIQISRIHAHHHRHHPLSGDLDPPVATQAAQNLGSRPSPSSPASRSRPPSTIFEAVGLPERPLAKSEKTGTSSLSRQDDGGRVWNRRLPGQGGASKGESPRPVAPEQRSTMVSRV